MEIQRIIMSFSRVINILSSLSLSPAFYIILSEQN